jgi:hypothetical protein
MNTAGPRGSNDRNNRGLYEGTGGKKVNSPKPDGILSLRHLDLSDRKQTRASPGLTLLHAICRPWRGSLVNQNAPPIRSIVCGVLLMDLTAGLTGSCARCVGGEKGWPVGTRRLPSNTEPAPWTVDQGPARRRSPFPCRPVSMPYSTLHWTVAIPGTGRIVCRSSTRGDLFRQGTCLSGAAMRPTRAWRRAGGICLAPMARPGPTSRMAKDLARVLTSACCRQILLTRQRTISTTSTPLLGCREHPQSRQ